MYAYVVANGSHHAASGTAVPVVVHVACLGRTILGVDEVVWGAELAGRGLAVRVGPRGDVGEVGGAGVSKDILAVSLRCGRDEVLGNVSDRFVAIDLD